MKKHLIIATVLILILNSCTVGKIKCRHDLYVPLNDHSKEIPTQVQQDKNQGVFSFERRPTLALANKSKEEEPNFYDMPKEKLILWPQQKRKSNINNNYPQTKSKRDNFTSRTATSSHTKQQNENESGDSLAYLTSVLMALTTLGLVRTNRKGVTKLTRWAKANPKKTQALIACMQLPLAALAFYSGHNLKELGYDLSNTSTYIFGALTALGFLFVPFWAKRNTIAIPKIINRQRLGYLGIILSSLMMMTSYGNHFVDKYPDSPVASVVNTIDRSIFPSNSNHIDKVNDDHPGSNVKTARKAAEVGICVLAVFLILLLLCTLCAGVCLIIFAVSGEIAIGYALLGLLVSGLSILGIYKSAKMCGDSNKTK